jgi:hypothetical protein
VGAGPLHTNCEEKASTIVVYLLSPTPCLNVDDLFTDGCDLAFTHEILECGKSNEGERNPGEQDAKVLSKVVLGVEDDGADNLRHVVDGEYEAILVKPDF